MTDETIKNLKWLIEDTRAHVPKDEKHKYWADRRLNDLCCVLEQLLPFGSLQVERIADSGRVDIKPDAPTKLWVLIYKENGKRKVAWSFDGPPSSAYVRLL